MKKIFSTLIIFFTLVFLPTLSLEAAIVPSCNTGEIVPAHTEVIDGETVTIPAEFENPCNFNYAMELINSIIDFLLFTIATPLAALIFVYAGVMLLTSGGNESKLNSAKTILKNVIIGYVIALAAWLIINTILSTLGFTGGFLS